MTEYLRANATMTMPSRAVSWFASGELRLPNRISHPGRDGRSDRT
jgi:hypothetical protein